MPSDLYTEEELQTLRLQLIKGNAAAREAAKKRGYTVDPRIAKANLK